MCSVYKKLTNFGKKEKGYEGKIFKIFNENEVTIWWTIEHSLVNDRLIFLTNNRSLFDE